VEQWRELADLNVAIISTNDVQPSNPDKHQHEIDTTRGATTDDDRVDNRRHHGLPRPGRGGNVGQQRPIAPT
jgi:hypothetical protein